MPNIQGVTNVAAGATNSNVLAGSIFEYLPFNAYIEFGVVGDAAGAARCTITSGQDVIMEEAPISRAARFPVRPDDFNLNDTARGGERLVVKVRNTGGAAIDVFWCLNITPV